MVRISGYRLTHLIGETIGFNIGKKIGKAFVESKIKKQLRDSNYNNDVIEAVINAWKMLGDSQQFFLDDVIEAYISKRLYQEIYGYWGEDCADYVESRIQKAKDKGIPIDINADFLDFLSKHNLELGNFSIEPITELIEIITLRVRYKSKTTTTTTTLDVNEEDQQESLRVVKLEVLPDNITKEEVSLMDEYDITYSNDKYHFGKYKYAKLEDAINYAKLQKEKS